MICWVLKSLCRIGNVKRTIHNFKIQNKYLLVAFLLEALTFTEEEAGNPLQIKENFYLWSEQVTVKKRRKFCQEGSRRWVESKRRKRERDSWGFSRSLGFLRVPWPFLVWVRTCRRLYPLVYSNQLGNGWAILVLSTWRCNFLGCLMRDEWVADRWKVSWQTGMALQVLLLYLTQIERSQLTYKQQEK